MPDMDQATLDGEKAGVFRNEEHVQNEFELRPGKTMREEAKAQAQRQRTMERGQGAFRLGEP